MFLFNFFFQAEDGIRYGHVTGVQTCALPISASLSGVVVVAAPVCGTRSVSAGRPGSAGAACSDGEIGRASGRERVVGREVCVAVCCKYSDLRCTDLLSSVYLAVRIHTSRTPR